MVVWSMKASTIKFFAVLFVCVAALVSVVVLVPSVPADASAIASHNNVRSNEDRLSFVSEFGWEVDPVPVSEVTVRIPSEFDSVYESYNDIQKSQGYNLERFKGKDVIKYSYSVKNYEETESDVFINILVYKNKIVGGDLSSANADGFVIGFDGGSSGGEQT